MKMLLGALVAIGLLWSPARAQPGAWMVSDTTSALDGDRSFTATVAGDMPVTDILGRDAPPHFGFSCGKNGLFVTVLWPAFVQKEYDEHNVRVVWKLDDSPVQTSSWFADTQAVSLLGNNALRWLTDAAKAKKLIIRVPDQYGGQEATFALDGIADLVAKVAARGCG
jgi:hypothetical protein